MLGTTLLLLSTVFTQETMGFQTKINPIKKGHDYLEESVPDGIQMRTLEGEPYKLKIEGATLIQVWSICCGGEPADWADQRYTEQVYSKRGLRVISINLENGKDANQQQQAVSKYFETKPMPEELYLDYMGYAYDSLGVRGFPTFLLINKEGKLFFRTSGKSPEGVALLDTEIQNMLE